MSFNILPFIHAWVYVTCISDYDIYYERNVTWVNLFMIQGHHALLFCWQPSKSFSHLCTEIYCPQKCAMHNELCQKLE